MGAVARKAAGAVGARMAATAERFWRGLRVGMTSVLQRRFWRGWQKSASASYDGVQDARERT